MKEQWKSIAGHEGLYEVSSLGRVRSFMKPVYRGYTVSKSPQRILAQHLNKKNGYLYIGLTNQKKEKRTYSVHRLVLTSFVGDCPDGMEACHDDGNKQKNSLANLRWDTRSNNNMDRTKHGWVSPIDVKGEKHPYAKLRNEDVFFIRSLYGDGIEIAEIARAFKMSYTAIKRIISRASWCHI